LSIHAISKKDEIVKAARREAEDIRHKIESFDERYSDVTKSLTKISDAKSSEIAGEFGRLEERLIAIKKEIESYEESNRVFARADEMASQVEFAMRHFTEILDESKERSKILEEFIDGIDEFRDAKKQLDRELKLYQAKRDNIAGIEAEIQGILALADMARNKTESIEASSAKIDQIESRIRALSDAYSGLDKRIAELHEYEEMIGQNLDNINKIDLLVNTFEARIGTFSKSISDTEKKMSKMKEYLAKIDEQTISLKAREHEIMNVMDKFHELDSLSEHLDERIKQISAMMGRVESVRNEVERTDSQLQSIATEANKKIKQLTDIVQSVPSDSGNHMITKQMKGNPSISKGINDAMVKMVRDLSYKGWTASDIAQSMMLEENTVRLIINTSA
jgi:chromosome segregation ATPase